MKIPLKVVLILNLMTLPFGMTYCTTLGEKQSAGSPPVITHSFASKEVSHGDMWKIYVEADDPDGDMWHFVCTVSGTRRGHRVMYVRVRKGDRAKLLGYLNVFFPAPQDAWGEWANLTLTLHMQDRRGNTSDKVTFPVALSRGVKQALPPSPFDTEGLKALGKIWVELPRLPRDA